MSEKATLLNKYPKGKIICSLFLLLAVFLCTGCPQTNGDIPETPENIPLSSPADMAKIGVDKAYPLSAIYTLMENITLANWTPIGSDTKPFTGTFNGNGKTITLNGFNQTVLDAGETYIGIFGYVKGASPSALVEVNNLTINSTVDDKSDVTGGSGQAVGLLAGYAENAVIDNITVSGSFDYYSNKTIYLGGVAGMINREGTLVKNSNNYLNMNIVPGQSTSLVSGVINYSYVGGFAGIFNGGAGIENCHNTGNVTADNTANTVQSGQVFVGGIAGGSGYAYTTNYKGYVIDSSSAGIIIGRARGFWTFAGGIAGTIVGGIDGNDAASTRIVRCWASGEIYGTAQYPYVGGVVGYNYYGALVSQSYFSGTVKTDKVNDYTGGIAGYNSQTTAPNNSRIEDCWSGGTVTGFNNAGGIVGQNQVNAFIRRSYSIAAVSAANNTNDVGGIAGLTVDDNAIAGCVDLTDNSSQKPLQTFYVDTLSWDFDNVWTMGADGYPKLKWQNN